MKHVTSCFSTFAGSELINRVVSHPSEPVSITAHENRTIRFLDNKTGICRRRFIFTSRLYSFSTFSGTLNASE